MIIYGDPKSVSKQDNNTERGYYIHPNERKYYYFFNGNWKHLQFKFVYNIYKNASVIAIKLFIGDFCYDLSHF